MAVLPVLRDDSNKNPRVLPERGTGLQWASDAWSDGQSSPAVLPPVLRHLLPRPRWCPLSGLGGRVEIKVHN